VNESIYAGNNTDRLTLSQPGPSRAERVAPRLEYWQKFPRMRRLMMLPPILVLSLAIGVALGAGAGAEPLIMLVAALVAIPLVWRRPVLGAYALILSAAAIETYSMGFPDSLTDRVPLHKPFDQMGLPLPVTATEVMLVGMLGLVVLKRIGSRLKPLEFGPLFPAIGIYTLFAIYGVVRGAGLGGEINIAVWEVRAQFYIPVMYLITYNLVTTREQTRRVMWLFLAAVAFKGLVGLVRFVVTLRGDTGQITFVSRANSLMSHEESLLFAGLMVFGILLFIFKADRPQLKLIAWALLPVALAFLANQRRAGMMAMILSLLVIAVVIYIQMPERRRTLVYVAIAAVLVLIPYIVVFRNASGIIAEPARAVLSVVRPDARDSGSNDYRVLEGDNVGQNIALDPVFGAGYGRRMVMFEQIPDLTAIFSLWAYIPHNTILWVWLRLGILGFAAFWFMVGRFMMGVRAQDRRPLPEGGGDLRHHAGDSLGGPGAG
jgi:O-antigen ligase